MKHDHDRTSFEVPPFQPGCGPRRYPAPPARRSGAAGALYPTTRTGSASLARTARRLLLVLARWYAKRQQRSRLTELDDHLLRDIGITRAEAEWEAQKSFWR